MDETCENSQICYVTLTPLMICLGAKLGEKGSKVWLSPLIISMQIRFWGNQLPLKTDWAFLFSVPFTPWSTTRPLVTLLLLASPHIPSLKAFLFCHLISFLRNVFGKQRLMTRNCALDIAFIAIKHKTRDTISFAVWHVAIIPTTASKKFPTNTIGFCPDAPGRLGRF